MEQTTSNLPHPYASRPLERVLDNKAVGYLMAFVFILASLFAPICPPLKRWLDEIVPDTSK